MRFSFNSGFKDFGDKRVHFNELEIFVNSYVHLTIRKYPAKTYITYHNDYRHFSKLLVKGYHSAVDAKFSDWMNATLDKMRIGRTSAEFDSVLDMYDKLRFMEVKPNLTVSV